MMVLFAQFIHLANLHLNIEGIPLSPNDGFNCSSCIVWKQLMRQSLAHLHFNHSFFKSRPLGNREALFDLIMQSGCLAVILVVVLNCTEIRH